MSLNMVIYIFDFWETEMPNISDGAFYFSDNFTLLFYFLIFFFISFFLMLVFNSWMLLLKVL